MPKPKLELELVLPCYNEAKSLEALLTRAATAARQTGFNPDTFSLIVVENGSHDDSAAVLKKLKLTELGQWFRVVAMNSNQGYGHGIWSGLQATTAPFVAWSHADQQCDPKDVFKAYSELKKKELGDVLVKGVRSGRNWKDIAVSRVFESFSRAFLGMRVHEINAQPKVFPRKLLDEIKDPPKNFAFDLYVLYRAVRAGYHIATVPVRFPPRIHGMSNWASNFASRRKTILNMIKYMWELREKEGQTTHRGGP